MKRQAHIVAHTHWDREWYLTMSRFRVNLVEAVGQVLDRLENDPEFPHFVLDGQACVLEDYIHSVPEDKARIGKLVAGGALAIGPWYILPDEFLVSGEATVRNRVFGRKAAPLGNVQNVGYMPDSFGHLAQIPPILQLAGLDAFIFTRGMGTQGEDPGWLFRWAAPDGSEVLAVNQDPLGRQGRRVSSQGDVEAWARELYDGSRAVVLFNRGDSDADMGISWPENGYPARLTASIRDLWRHEELGRFAGGWSVRVPSHGAVMIRVSP